MYKPEFAHTRGEVESSMGDYEVAEARALNVDAFCNATDKQTLRWSPRLHPSNSVNVFQIYQSLLQGKKIEKIMDLDH